MGFGIARPDRITEIPMGPHPGPADLVNPSQSDYYQHPAERNDPNVRYSRSFDIYSLGCVLLEFAHWRLLDELPDMKESNEGFKRRLQRTAEGSQG